jgi:hypothetical protein
MFKLKDNVWINPDAVSQISVSQLSSQDPCEIRVFTSSDEEAYYIIKVGTPEQAVAQAEKLAEAIEAGTTRDRLNCLVDSMFDIIDILRNRL